MGFRLSRRVMLFPGVRLNFSRSGISASIGPRGASVTVGHRGSTANLGIPGTGLSFRQQLNGETRDAHRQSPALRDNPTSAKPAFSPEMTAIQSAPTSELTSDELAPVKALIRQVLVERETLHHSIPRVRKELAAAERRLWRSENWFFGIFLKGDVKSQSQRSRELRISRGV